MRRSAFNGSTASVLSARPATMPSFCAAGRSALARVWKRWRAKIRRQARQDKVRVVTWRTGEGRAFAMLARTLSDDRVFEVKQWALEQVLALGEVAELSRVLGHQLNGWCATRMSSSRSASVAGRASTSGSPQSGARTAKRSASSAPANSPSVLEHHPE